MADLANAEPTREWIAQFLQADRTLAEELVDSILTVSADRLMHDLHEKLSQRIQSGDGPVALYTERELPRESALFQQPSDRPQRAYGNGPSPTSPENKDVGSEGIVSNIITQLQRGLKHSGLVFSHPSPDDFRSQKIRRLIIATDFIGSGSQILSYLDAAWEVRSVQSWWSRKLLRFEVVAYAATGVGERRVKSHKCKPVVHSVIACPTIQTAFAGGKQNMMSDLCMRYNPGMNNRSKNAFGYGGIGALIAFAHGAPNNCPSILTSAKRGWKPLFENRRTATTRENFSAKNEANLDAQRALRRMGQGHLSDWIKSQSPQSVVTKRLLVMAALMRGARTDEAISVRTQLPLKCVQEAIRAVQKFGWITTRRRLTDDGRREICHIKNPPQADAWTFPSDDKPWYFPKRLRAPR